MSAFLGPIHFWLYNKITKQEELTKVIAEHARSQGWITDAENYTADLPELESAIDLGNIHGWLQEQIHDAEKRYADLIISVTDNKPGNADQIFSIAYNFGKTYGVPTDASPAEIYKAFEDFFLNGMPCDRVNMITEDSEESLTWEMTQDIHAQYWNGRPDLYYRIRQRVMDGMLSETPFCVKRTGDMRYTIEKK